MNAYRHAGLPLTSAIAAELLREALERGACPSNFSRAQAEQYVRALHENRGGVPSRKDEVVHVKGPLQVWKKSGWVDNPRVGRYIWRGAVNGDGEYYDTDLAHECPEIADEEVNTYVYMFYYETDYLLATLQGLPFWPCKVGRTHRSARSRVAEQFNSYYHSKPKISVVWPTDNPVALEKAIHGLLELKNRRLPESVGNEWFYTNPEELTQLLAQIDS